MEKLVAARGSSGCHLGGDELFGDERILFGQREELHMRSEVSHRLGLRCHGREGGTPPFDQGARVCLAVNAVAGHGDAEVAAKRQRQDNFPIPGRASSIAIMSTPGASRNEVWSAPSPGSDRAA